MFTIAGNSFGVRLAIIFILIIGMLGVQPPTPALAATLTVTNTNDSGAGSLRQAITGSTSGGIIVFDPSLAGQTITLTSILAIDKNLTIDGSSLMTRVNISGNNSVTIFLVNAGVTATIKSLIIKNGRSTSNGGALSNAGTLTIIDSVFSANNAVVTPYVVGLGEGGAIITRGALTIINTAFEGNTASRGGAISCMGGTISITDSTYSSNNTVSDVGGDGGAIYGSCSLMVLNSTFSANTAAHYGGAILTDYDLGQSKVTNSTFSGNTAQFGGGIANYGGLLISNSTFSNNISPSGGAVYEGIGGVLSTRNSILANSVGGVDCIKSDGAPAIENINNLIETTGADFESCGISLLTSDPLLGLLQDNGGFTQTMALLPNSPAINAGDGGNCPSTDQRGVARPQGGQCDMGAYEVDDSYVDIYIGGMKMNANTYQIPPGGQESPFFPGTFNGPVEVRSTSGKKILASERALYGSSFTETLGIPNNQLTTDYWFPWYDGLTMRTWISIGAPTTNTQDALVDIYIGGTKMNPTSYHVAPGGQVTPTPNFPGTFNGPVEVRSTNGQNIFVSERAIYGNSFTETLGVPGNQLTTDYWFPWYDGLTMRTWISTGAPTTNTQDALVDIYIGGTKMNPTSYHVAPGGQVTPTPNFPGTFNGPVEVRSTNGQNIFVSERAIYGSSFTETLGIPNNQLTTRYWFSWYDTLTMNTWVAIGAPTTNTQDAIVDIYVGGTKVNPTSYHVAPGGQVTPTPNFPGTFNGPVEVVSTNGQNIFVSERAIYGGSFAETLGMADNRLTTDYWFPWYDGLTMRTWLSIGVP